MADDLMQGLTRFYREVVVPDMKTFVETEITPLRHDVLSLSDEIYQRFDRIEAEYQSLKSAVSRIEARLKSNDEKIDRMALRSDLLEIKESLVDLTRRVAQLESDL